MNNNDYIIENEKFINNDEIDLKEIWKSVIRKKKIIILSTSIIFLIGVFNTIKNRLYNPVYSGSFLLLISDPIGASGGAEIEPSPLSIYSNLATSSTNNDVPTLVTFLKSPYLLDNISKKYDMSSKSLSGMLEISQVRTSNDFADGVLEVKININNYEIGDELLKDLGNVYLDSALDQKRQRLKDGIKFLDDQAPMMRKRTKELQDKLSIFRKENLLIAPIAEGLSIKQTEKFVTEKIKQYESSINKLLKIKDKVSSGLLSARSFKDTVLLNQGGVEISSEDSLALTQSLLLEQEIETARSKFTEDSNYIKSLKSRLDAIKPRLLEGQLSALENAIYLIRIDLEESIIQKNKLTNSFKKKPDLINKYNTLQEELRIAKENLIGLISAKETFQLEIAQSAVPWKIISQPTMNPNPVKPSIPKGIGFSGIIALVIGTSIGILRDRLDHVFHDPNEVQDSLKKPILGNIPYVSFLKGSRENKSKILDLFEQKDKISNLDKEKNYERFIWQESMRNIATSLRFLNTDLQVKSIAITSSSPAEGKSSAVILLAKALSDLGLKVLLIDADLRKPQLHFRLGLNNIQGFSNLLSNKNLNFKDLIQPADKEKNWYLLTAGQKVPDPTRLFSSNRMIDVTEQISLNSDFDYILYDTPPALGFADPALISSKLNGFILLVSIFNVDRDLPKVALKRMNSLGAKNLGIISNNQIKSELIQSSKDYTYKDYADYYSVTEDSSETDIAEPEELLSFKNILKQFQKNKKINYILDKLNKFLKWLDR